ncbi:MAG: isocitrate lyase/phosphoenolpyruvate mutase family protein [Pseudomonadota bacterium]
MTALKSRLKERRAVLAPGVYDALSALLVEQAGFEACYLSGASIAYTQIGAPDLGLTGPDLVADVIARIRDRVGLPIIVDGDTGFGNALNVQRTVRTFERAGANAIQLEDQVMPKRCGHLAGKELVSLTEMTGKIAAALDARASEETLIIARTDGIAVEGFAAALERAEAYAAAGADVLFVEAPQSLEQMETIAGRLGPRAPLLANMVEGGKTPLKNLAELESAGFSLVITPGAMVRAFVHMAEGFLAALKEDGSTQRYAERMLNFTELNSRLGLSDLLDLGAHYEGAKKDAAE